MIANDPYRQPVTIAHHEAGHAIAGLLFGGPFRPVKVVMVDDDLGGARCYNRGPRRALDYTPDAYAAQCPRKRRQVWAHYARHDAIVSLAGRAAADRLVGDRSSSWDFEEGAIEDVDKAEHALRCFTWSEADGTSPRSSPSTRRSPTPMILWLRIGTAPVAALRLAVAWQFVVDSRPR